DFTPAQDKKDQAEDGKLAWHLDYIDAWKDSVKGQQPKLIFIDFTGVFCTNCYDNEHNVFPKPEVRQELAKYVRVQLFTDSIPDAKLEAEGQAKRNSRWQLALVKDITNPFYVIFKPSKDKPFDKD